MTRNIQIPRIVPQPRPRPMPVLVPIPITRRTYRVPRGQRTEGRSAKGPPNPVVAGRRHPRVHPVIRLCNVHLAG